MATGKPLMRAQHQPRSLGDCRCRPDTDYEFGS
jgi:hypothetical protein